MADMSEDLRSGALFYHRFPKPGKLEIQPTKPLGNQRDLALAYSPGVAVACTAIADDPAEAAELTVRQNLVAVVSNGTAVLGLGNIGPLASKPVMEGKAVLFKKFAGIDVFDIEVARNGRRPDRRRRGGAGADLRRHQSRGHQGPGVFRDRGAAAGPHGHPGVPRRPARHRDHRGGRGRQRAGIRRQGHRRDQDRHLGRRRGGARLPQPARDARRQAREHLGHRHRGRGLPGPHGADGPLEGALCAGDREAHARRGDRGRRRVHRPLGRRRAEARDAGPHGADAADHGAGQSDARDHAGSRPHRRGRTR